MKHNILPASWYRAAATQLRTFATKLEQRDSPATPRERASLTTAIHSLSRYAARLSSRHRRGDSDVKRRDRSNLPPDVGFTVTLSPEADVLAYIGDIEGYTVAINGVDYVLNEIGIESICVTPFDEETGLGVGAQIEIDRQDVTAIHIY